MAKKAMPKKNWSRTNGSKLATTMRGVSSCIKKNSGTFTNPAVKPDQMDEQAERTDSAYNNRENGKEGRAAYKAVMAESNTMMENVADYVGEVANGNTEIIAAADFESTKTSGSKVAVPHSPNPPVLANANGEISMKLKSVKGASSYCYIAFVGEPSDVSIVSNQILFSPKANVVVFPASSTRECLKGVVSGTRIYVAALAQNASGKSPLSSMVSICVA